jgi:DNA-binding response OmpR family regulator
MHGYTVLGTTDPREALRWARQHSGPIHLLVSDVVMPLMHGRELAQELRAIIPGVKVLFMSGASPSEVADHGIGLAFGQPYLVKPFAIAALTSKVRAALDYRSPFSKPPPH